MRANQRDGRLGFSIKENVEHLELVAHDGQA
jgi:hypothetical protein